MSYKTIDKSHLAALLSAERAVYDGYKKEGISLAMSRGIPNTAMIELAAEKFSKIDVYTDRIHKDGADIGTYNQGLIAGITEMKDLFSDILDVRNENLIIGGNSSLNLMYDLITQMMLHGNCDSEKPWAKEEIVKFICPVPGYDRHFAICEYMGIGMINVPMGPEGPDTDMIADLVSKDSSIKGMWCVPQYSNPDGAVYSEKAIRALASMI